EPVLERNRTLAAYLTARLAPLADHPHVAEVRQTGLIAAVEVVADKATRTPFPAHERRGLRARLDALARGVVLRPLGEVIYTMPPYCTTLEEIDLIVDAIASGVSVACR
ncbi:adenosylmethionine-8-amino-7-oxononanoate aminotransferase, partial [mine drainage metagenome]